MIREQAAVDMISAVLRSPHPWVSAPPGSPGKAILTVSYNRSFLRSLRQRALSLRPLTPAQRDAVKRFYRVCVEGEKWQG